MSRNYDPDRPVSDETLGELLDLAGRAPSAGFSQGRDVVVLRERHSIDDFWDISTRDRVARPATQGPPPEQWLLGMRCAPVLMLWLSDPERYLDRYGLPDKGGVRPAASDWPVPFWDVDTGMAAMIVMLAAQDVGLGSCFFGIERGSEIAVAERFGIPPGRRLVGVTSLGYPGPTDARATRPAEPNPHRPRKRPVGDFAHAERFGVGWRGAIPVPPTDRPPEPGITTHRASPPA